MPLAVRHAPDNAVKIKISVPESTHTGGAPIVTEEDADASMSALLAVAAGQELPEVSSGAARINLAWTPDLVADHAGVTAAGMPDTLSSVGNSVPDVLVGACWPAVFAVLGATQTDRLGKSVIEGMLDLVHLDHQVQLLKPLPAETSVLSVKAEAGEVLDTDLGRVVEVTVTIGSMRDQGIEAPTFATLVERFAIRGRTGTGELADPPRAGGSLSTDAVDTPRRRRRDVTIVAPTNMGAFAQVSGDHNPIHTSNGAALLAGLGTPIVHGMWLSAAAQHAVVAVDPDAKTASAKLTAWTARFLGMVRPGASIDLQVNRVGIDAGAEIIEVSCRVGGDLVMVATGRTAAPKTAYAFPGQGIQAKGMGLDARTRSKAAKEVWDRADEHTRKALGFSILAVVRDNPTYLKARGVEHRHPDGVLHLTQFTQVAMAVLGVAQVAELRESGAYVEGATLAGHSVGEYNALAAVAGVLPLEAVLEVVFQRGSAMHELVPRDAYGRSNYRMAAIRPSQFGLPDDEVIGFVAETRRAHRRVPAGRQPEPARLAVRDRRHGRRPRRAGDRHRSARSPSTAASGRSSWCPASTYRSTRTFCARACLSSGASSKTCCLRSTRPSWSGATCRTWCRSRSRWSVNSSQEIADLVPSEPLNAVLADFDSWSGRPSELARVILVELLAWQFASPVRWIETQDLLFTDEAHGGLGIERFVEIGLAPTPTVANLATNTLKLPGRIGGPVEVLNVERERAVVYATDVDPEPVEEETAETPAAAEAPAAAAAGPRRCAGPGCRSGGWTAPGRHRFRCVGRDQGAHRAVDEAAPRPDRSGGHHRGTL